MLTDHVRNRISSTLLLIGLLLAGGTFLLIARSHAERAHVIPPPVADEPMGGDATEVAVLAGGCFWGVQGVFQHVNGVTGAVSGYAGGEPSTAQYETVGTGATGHAETVRVNFDPHRISYGRICRSTSRWRTIRRSSTGKVRTSARSIAPRSFRPMRARPRSPRPISPSLARRMHSPLPS